MGRLFYSADELLRRPLFPGMHDPTHLYNHFRPARPADIVVTRDPLSGELNAAAGTYGVLTERPLTLCLHSAKRSYDTTRNTQGLGSEFVVALPTRRQLRELSICALRLPPGISPAALARFHAQVARWSRRWDALFPDLQSAGRAELRQGLTTLIRLIAQERWPELAHLPGRVP